jgi:chloramphenicol O-acetyltransferase
MKKLLFTGAVLFASFASAATTEDFSEIETKEEAVLTECNTQTTQDADGDTISVTCCRTTYQEAYDCAAKKLRALALAPEG